MYPTVGLISSRALFENDLGSITNQVSWLIDIVPRRADLRTIVFLFDAAGHRPAVLHLGMRLRLVFLGSNDVQLLFALCWNSGHSNLIADDRGESPWPSVPSETL